METHHQENKNKEIQKRKHSDASQLNKIEPVEEIEDNLISEASTEATT